MIAGVIDASDFHSDTDLLLSKANLKSGIDLSYSSFGGTGELDLSRTTCDNVNLQDVKIDGQVDLTAASVSGKINADGMHLGQILIMRSEGTDRASFNDVVLRGAKIDDQIDLTGASVTGTLDGDGVRSFWMK